MLPALAQLLATFPFKIKGFHTDNGGEVINYTVAKLLEKLRIEFTKSRPRHSKASAPASINTRCIAILTSIVLAISPLS